MSIHSPRSGKSQDDLEHDADTFLPDLHRIRPMRLSQGITLRSAAKWMGSDVDSVREQQRETSDLLLSVLYRWAALLDVDVPELIIDDAASPEERISAHRLRLARWMKIVLSIYNSTSQNQIKAYSHRCMQNLVELRPDLVGLVSGPDGPRLEMAESIDSPHAKVFDPEQLHQIKAVRLREGITLRTVHRRMFSNGLSMDDLREQEKPSADLRITDVRRWREVLNVPLSEFFPGSEPLSREIRERAIVVKLVKSLQSLKETAQGYALQRISKLASAVIVDISELMPQVENVDPWLTVGHRRTSDELGMTAMRTLNLRELGLPAFEED